MDQTICSTRELQAGMKRQEEGKEYVYLYVPSACVKNTPYMFYTISSGEPCITAITDVDSTRFRIVVATETLTAAGYSWFILRGVVDALIVATDTYVIGEIVWLAEGVTAPSGAATLDDYGFAVPITITSTTAIKAYLLGRELTNKT